jgi:hypothetical protein
MPRLSLRKAVHAAIVISWAVMMTLLLYRHYGPSSKTISVSCASLPRGIFGERWMGIYFNDKKNGYATRTFRKSADGYSLSQRMALRLGIMGSQKDMELEPSAVPGTDLGLNSCFLKLKADSNINGNWDS